MIWKYVGIAAAVVVLAGLLGIVVLRAAIVRGLDDAVETAWRAEPAAPDEVTALLAFVADETHPIDRRNRAVWALGQLRDPRALPVLAAYVKEECRHGEELCQHELAKAIATIEDPVDLLRVAGR